MLRPLLALAAGALVAAAGALLLGEYAFTGWPIFGACLLLGLFVAEAVVTAGRRNGAQAAALAALLTLAGLIWAAWISSGHELNSLPDEGWFAVAVGAIASGLTALWTRGATGSRPASSPEE